MPETLSGPLKRSAWRALTWFSRLLASLLARHGRNSQEILEALWPFRVLLERLRCRGVVFDANEARFLYNSDDLINLKLALVGGHEFDTTHVIRTRVRPQDVFVDVGANLGYFSILAALKATRGRVIALEPSPRSFEALRANVALNGLTNVTPMQSLLWRERGRELELRVVDRFNLGANSILGTGHTEAVGISTTLDDVVEELSLRSLDVLKIDVEGAELDVLLGGLRSLNTLRPRLLIFAADNPDEGTRRAAVDLIMGAGYQETDPITAALRKPRAVVGRSLLFFEQRTDVLENPCATAPLAR